MYKYFVIKPAIICIILVLISALLISIYAFAQSSREGNIEMDTSDSNKKDLKKILTEEQYHVAVDNGTEPAFRNAYWDNKQEGIYVDVISGDPLFISTDKFNSGTGWPSFTRPVNKNNIIEISDKTHGMIRTEVRSKNSNSHLGHVFTDGPEPTGQRYCINSAALRFIPADKLEKEGYSKYSELFIKENKKAVKHTGSKKTATFGAGCFWGVEASFQNISGVLSTAVGFMGGALINPTYEDVCTKNTGHAEVVHVKFDPDIVSYRELLETFWKIHNPTTLNRQGPDFGTQYRSAVFYHNEEQKKEAVKYKNELNKNDKYNGRIVTEITEAAKFYRAEEYHQKYIQKKGGGSCKF